MSQDTVVTIDVEQLANVVSMAVVQALSGYVQPSPAPEPKAQESAPKARTIDEVNAETEKVRTKRNHARQAQAAPKVQSDGKVKAHYDCSRPKGSDGYIPGLVAGYKVPRELIDKDVNTATQCNVRTCRHLRKGKARFCKAHGDENYKLMLAGKGGTLDEVKRKVTLPNGKIAK